jgi:uncharacterized phiE125 gp8 family phage protein
MPLRLVIPPASEPVSLDEAKAHLRVDGNYDDGLIGNLITSARKYLDGKDGILGRALVSQTWELVLDTWPTSGCGFAANAVQIPLPPLTGITSVKYFDTDGNEQTFSSANYTIDAVSEPGWIVLDQGVSWPALLNAANVITIRFTAGYATVPEPISQAILLLIGHWYANRENVLTGFRAAAIDVPYTVDALSAPYRLVSF